MKSFFTVLLLVATVALSYAPSTQAASLRFESGRRGLEDFVEGVAIRATKLFRTGQRLSDTLEDGGLNKIVEVHRAPRPAPSDCPGDAWVEGLMGCIDNDDSQGSLLDCISCKNIVPFRKCDHKLGSYLGYCETCTIESIRANFPEECKLCTLSPQKMFVIKNCGAV